MLGERSEQRGLWEADRLYLDHVGKDTFYGLLASQRGRLFRDADFAEFYARTTAGTACRPACWRRPCCCRPTTRSATRRPGPGRLRPPVESGPGD